MTEMLTAKEYALKVILPALLIGLAVFAVLTGLYDTQYNPASASTSQSTTDYFSLSSGQLKIQINFDLQEQELFIQQIGSVNYYQALVYGQQAQALLSIYQVNGCYLQRVG